ncbi:MAG: dockerin type I repeat-containing protein [Oscillospiraceae bacterium]|nr:dockerin type I repeat-containing protein [Oscillospiraceae bacterium]
MGIIDEKYKSYAENIKIFAANGNEVTNNDTIMCTGMTVLLMDGGQIKESATVAVKGDVTGEGIASVADARMILRYAAGLDKFSDIQLLAGDLTGAGSVGAAEARTVLRYNAKLADRL